MSGAAEEPLLRRVGATVSSNRLVNARLMHNPKFRALLVESLFALTAFAFMAKQTDGLAGPDMETLNACGIDGCGFTSFYQFKGIVGVFAAFWTYSVVLIGLYVIRRAPPPGTELVIHALFTLMMILFWFMSIVACSNTVLESDYTVCKTATYGKASLAFAFFCVVLNAASCVFCWRQWGELRYVGLPSKLTPTSFAPAAFAPESFEDVDDAE